MSDKAKKYAAWLVNNENLKGTPEYKTVADGYTKLRSQPVEQPKEHDPYTAENIIGSAVEPLMTLGSGAAATPWAGLTGLGYGMTNLLGITDREPADVVRAIQERGTYQPKTKGGQIATEAITYPLHEWEKASEYVGGEVTDRLGPGMGATTKTGLMMVPAMFGGKGVTGQPYLTRKGKAPLQPIEKAIKSPAVPVKAVSDAVIKAGKNLLPRHRERAGRLLTELGGESNPAIIAALQRAKEGETAGQAVADVGTPQFLAVEKLMKQRKPEEFSDVGKIRESQQAGRVGALQEEAGTQATIAEAVAKRKAEADPLYAEGRAGEAKGIPDIVTKIDELISKNPGNKELITALSDTKKGLVDAEGNIRTSGQEVLSTVPSLKSAIANKDNAFIKQELTKIKNDIVASSPKFKEGQKVYGKLSEPVNQMQIFTQLIKEISPRIGAKERATQFVNALENARLTIKKATDGKPRFESLEGALTPEQLAVIDKIRTQLDKEATLSQKSTAGYKQLNKMLDDVLAPPEAPGMISSTMMVFRNIMKRLKGHASEETLNFLAENWNNPPEVARIMKEMSPQGQAIIRDYMQQTNRAAVGGAIAAQQTGE